jgi:hypothetical protein
MLHAVIILKFEQKKSAYGAKAERGGVFRIENPFKLQQKTPM